jgi:hypothetical protein
VLPKSSWYARLTTLVVAYARARGARRDLEMNGDSYRLGQSRARKAKVEAQQ